MSSNAAAAGGGSVTGFILLSIQGIPLQSMVEVFIFGLIGGIAGILGKLLAEFIVRKIKKLFKIKSNEKQK